MHVSQSLHYIIQYTILLYEVHVSQSLLEANAASTRGGALSISGGEVAVVVQ